MTFYVGPDNVVFHVHQDLLFDASPVFKAAFSSKFKEASDRSMSLPDDDKDSVERMIKWLYTRKLELTIPSKETSEECFMQLANLNTLADKYYIYLLKNRIVDELFDLQKAPRQIGPPQMAVVAYIYSNTIKGSFFRKLMVAWHAYHIDFKWCEWDTSRDMLAIPSPEFAIDLAIELGRRLKHLDRKSPFTLPSSNFHETPPKTVD